MNKLSKKIAFRGLFGLSCLFLMFPHSDKNTSSTENKTYVRHENNIAMYLNAKNNHNGIRRIVIPSDKKGYDFDNDGIKDKYIICKDGSYIIHNSSSGLWKDIGLGI